MANSETIQRAEGLSVWRRRVARVWISSCEAVEEEVGDDQVDAFIPGPKSGPGHPKLLGSRCVRRVVVRSGWRAHRRGGEARSIWELMSTASTWISGFARRRRAVKRPSPSPRMRAWRRDLAWARNVERQRARKDRCEALHPAIGAGEVVEVAAGSSGEEEERMG